MQATRRSHPGRDCPAGSESRPLSSVAGGMLSAAGGSGVRSARATEGCKRQELPSSRLGKLPGLPAAQRACTGNSRWSEFPGGGVAAPHVLLPGFAHPRRLWEARRVRAPPCCWALRPPTPATPSGNCLKREWGLHLDLIFVHFSGYSSWVDSYLTEHLISTERALFVGIGHFHPSTDSCFCHLPGPLFQKLDAWAWFYSGWSQVSLG